MDDDYWSRFPEPLPLRSIATILRFSEVTVLRRLQDGTIPGHFVGGSWIVFQCEFRAWLSTARNQPPPALAEADPLASYRDPLTISDLMGLFDKTKQTIRKWLNNGTIPGYRIRGHWRVHKSDLREVLNVNTNQHPIA
jgi:excisionase family DNA binding protein